MKRRLLAALAAFGLVATMTGLGSIPAMAEEPVDPTTTVEPASTEPPATETTSTETQTEASTETQTEASTETSTEPSTEPASTEPTEPTEPETSTEVTGPDSTGPPTAAEAARFSSVSTFSAVEASYAPGDSVDQNDYKICIPLDSGKIDIDSETPVPVSAPANMVIVAYCVKAGSENSWTVVLGSPSSSTTVTHPEKPGVSHYSLDYECVEGYTGVYNTAGQLIACEEDEQEPVYASAQVSTTEGTCFAAGTVVPGDKVNAEFDPATYENGQYKIVAHATGDAVFPQGPGVSPDGKTKTFEGPIDPMLEEGCEKIDICHATPPETAANGWNHLSLPPAGVLSGHADHAKDIIPAFGNYPGKNLDTVFVVNGEEVTGQQILDAGCNFDIKVPEKPSKSNEYCDDGYVQDGSITVYFGTLGDKIQYRITGPNTDILIENGDPTTVYLPAGNYTVTAEGVPPWEIDGKYEWDVKIKDAHCKVWVPDPEYGGEQCYEGETVDGYIWVDYSNGLDDKIRYRITGPDTNLVVDPNGSWTTYLPAGDYVVTVEPLADWIVKGDNYPYDLTITSATNCQCYVPPTIEKDSLSILADIAPVCAEAEVSVTVPTCEAAGELQLGETLLATWGEPVIENGHYTVVATADDGYRFAPGEGVSDDGFTKTFEGDLPGKLTNCGDLPTLALTGSGDGSGLLWLAGLATLLGITGVVAGYRRSLRVEKQQ